MQRNKTYQLFPESGLMYQNQISLYVLSVQERRLCEETNVFSQLLCIGEHPNKIIPASSHLDTFALFYILIKFEVVVNTPGSD
jgi:hypothetical protein